MTHETSGKRILDSHKTWVTKLLHRRPIILLVALVVLIIFAIRSYWVRDVLSLSCGNADLESGGVWVSIAPGGELGVYKFSERAMMSGSYLPSISAGINGAHIPVEHARSLRFLRRSGNFGVRCYIPLWIPAAVIVFFIARSVRKAGGPDVGPRCAVCGYNLTGNVSGRCPECGTTSAERLQQYPRQAFGRAVLLGGTAHAQSAGCVTCVIPGSCNPHPSGSEQTRRCPAC
jgi:hypothetical protein